MFAGLFLSYNVFNDFIYVWYECMIQTWLTTYNLFIEPIHWISNHILFMVMLSKLYCLKKATTGGVL